VFMRVAVVATILAGLLSCVGCFFFGGGGTGGHQMAFITAPLNSGIAVYTISDITGKFTELLGSPYPTGISPTQAVLAPSGKFVYVASGNGTLAAFTVDSFVGTLTPVSGSPYYTAQASVVSAGTILAIDPAGKFLYLAGSSNL